jgi:hypothetical protein
MTTPESELAAANATIVRLTRELEVARDQVATLQKIIREDTTPAGREVASWRQERDDLRRELAKLHAESEGRGELIAGQRAELCLVYDVIDALPTEALDAVDDAKLMKLMRCMDEEQKRKEIRDCMSDLVEENERLRARLLAARITRPRG